MNVEIGAEAAQFPEKEYINGIAVAVQFSTGTITQLLRPPVLYLENPGLQVFTCTTGAVYCKFTTLGPLRL